MYFDVTYYELTNYKNNGLSIKRIIIERLLSVSCKKRYRINYKIVTVLMFALFLVVL